MKHSDKDRAESEVIISYLADKKQTFAEKKLSKKMLMALIISCVYLISLGSIYTEYFLPIIGYGALILMFMFLLIIPLSFVTEHKAIRKKVYQIPLAIVLQVIIPTLLVLVTDSSYGLIPFSVLLVSLIFMVCDFVFVKTMK
ncbi:hypothetical protein [Cohnella sp. AR92]|uniref:hypothetical protein n=1 Tax=Cohnella sp. AR92 TaxID=648716 RepID=UPI000F8F2E40|nr:hypothetical protein [Cohnella sp. AR92]RUS45835.1 hypothetical protein ELR57_18460 [Cohnella sp. AR92]